MAGLLDYRSPDDKAWYTVAELVLDEERLALTVKFVDFDDDEKEVFNAKKFKTAQEVEQFLKRFRPACAQLQDNECKIMKTGSEICALHIGEKEQKFYNGLIQTVHRKKHKPDRCSCEFVVWWSEGPMTGKTETMGIECVCQRKDGCPLFNQALKGFIKLSKAHIGS